ncbi:MAG: hypothetical protein RBT34_00265 [Anaerolineaceae bacterium]|jgi:hypothetical protein|nr:hypothetical protein [Anaerolineaceae bacterium]
MNAFATQAMPATLRDATSTLTNILFPPTLQEALSLLQDYYFQRTALKVARDMRPEKLEEYLTGNSYPQDYLQVCSLIHEVLFPLDDWSTDQESEWGESRFIFQEALSPFGQIGWSDWEEMMDEIPDQPQDNSLTIFLRFLHINESEERWKTASKHFGWKIPYPKLLKHNSDSTQYDFNETKYAESLEKAKLGAFIRAYEFVNFCTDNEFLDYNMADISEGATEPLPFNESTLRLLTQAYEESDAWINDYETANRMVRANPAVLKEYNKIFWGAFERKTPQPQTLAEIFAGEEIEETQCQTLMIL